MLESVERDEDGLGCGEDRVEDEESCWSWRGRACRWKGAALMSSS